VAVAAVVAIIAYATLPWWMPTSVLKQWVADDMARQMGVEVMIDQMSIGWGKGVQITGFTVAGPDGFGGEPLLTVERIHTEFAPLRYLFAKRIEVMEVEQPRLLVIVRADGTTNVTPLTLLEFDVNAEHVTVRDAVATLDLPGRDERTQLDVSSIHFDAGGRQKKRWQVALSAELEQEEGAAPIKLRVDAGDGPAVAGRATFSFSNVDLDRLALPELLHLPVSEFGGLCSGSVVLQVDRNSVVDQLSLDLSVAGLNLQPTNGPELPVIDQADVALTATYDPLAPDGRLDVRSMRVRLPDTLELVGRGVVYTDLINTSWQAIESIELKGRVWPSRLAEVFTGRKDLGESGVTATGPVVVDISADRRQSELDVRVGVNAIAAAVSRGDEILKPLGRTLMCSIAGTFDERSDVLVVDRDSYVELGGNRVWGFGTVHNARRQLDRLREEDQDLSLLQVIQAIAEVDWTGGIELTDSQAILDLMPQSAPALDEVALDGMVTADLFTFERAGRRIELQISAPAGTQLALGRWFAKPADQSMKLTLAAAIDPAGGMLDDIDAKLTCGPGHLSVDNGWAALGTNGEESDGTIQLAGNITAEQCQAIVACLSPLADRASGARGAFHGQYDATYDPATGEGNAAVHVRDIQVLWGAQADQFDHDPAAPGGKVAGDALVRAERSGDGVITVALNGDHLEARLVDGELVRRKRSGDRARGRVTVRPGEPVTADLSFGDSELTIALPADMADEQAALSYQATLAVDKALLAAAPELAELADRVDLSGEVQLTGELPYRGAGDITAAVDAGDLAFQINGQLVKPRGAVMEASVRAAGGEDGSVAVTIERGLLGQVDVTGQVDFRRSADPDGRRTWRAAGGQLQFASDHGESLAAFAPGLADRLVVAAGQADLNWTADATAADLRWRTDLEELIFRHNGKNIQLAGDLAADISLASRPDDGGQPDKAVGPGERGVRIESLRADALEFWIDDCHGYVVADLTGLPRSATGSVHLLAGKMDTKALANWLGGDKPPDESKPPRPTDDEAAALVERALAAIDAFRPFALDSKLQLNVNIDDLRVYDSAVEQFYDLKNVSLTGTVDRGYVLLDLAAGVNSGTLHRQYQTHLSDDAPVVRYEAELLDVIARENVRPQIALSFPGNTVTGFFNRSDDLEMTLQAVIANSLDWRYPLRPTGHAETIAIEGITEGQAAPKFIARMFPGLNTARYEYKKMTAFADYGEDGLVINDMVFDGHDYDMYMDGTTDADNIGRYEIGVILLSQPQSAEWNHTYRQGRLPILKFEGRVERGKLHDVTVNYPWPNETLYVIFMKNNYLYRVWLEQKRRRENE